MRQRVSVRVVAQSLLIEGAVVLALWANLPWISVAGLGLLGSSLVFMGRSSRRGIFLGWLGCIVAWAGADTGHVWEGSSGLVAGLVAVAIWLNGTGWKTMAVIWSFLAAVLFTGAGYLQNAGGLFYLGLLGGILSLLLLRARFKLCPSGIQVANTLLLVIVGLPMADFLASPGYRIGLWTETWQKYYSYRDAKGNSAALVSWWRFFRDEQYPRMGKEIYDVMPTAVPAHRLRPNSHGTLLRSAISINSGGFRGKEIPAIKGNTYRIVALGESTTFGMTLAPDDKPWPELLEQMIAERLKPSRPVEVINAGVPGYALINNLDRLSRDILPLHPDMIISYHGYNGFGQIDRALPAAEGPQAPAYQARPLKLLASCEYRIKMFLFRRHYVPDASSREVWRLTPLQTSSAYSYRELIAAAETNRIRLVLANFSMAVNTTSDKRIIEFYRPAFYSIDREMEANKIHSLVVQELAAQHPDVCFVDTHPHLDGENEKFIDLVHLTQEGRRQLAENIFAGIRAVLEKDLRQPASN